MGIPSPNSLWFGERTTIEHRPLPRGTRNRTLQIGLVRDRKGPNVTKFPSFLTLRLLLSTDYFVDTYNTNITGFVLDNHLSIASLTGRLSYDEFWQLCNCLFKHESMIRDGEITNGLVLYQFRRKKWYFNK